MHDEIVVARELEARLTKLGYEVAAIASSQSDAIAITAKTAPDLVLMDIKLRDDMNSMEVANELHRYFSRRNAARGVHEMEDRFFTASIDVLCFSISTDTSSG